LTGIQGGIDSTEELGDGILTIHVQVNDPDFDTSASGEDKIAQIVEGSDSDNDGKGRGPVKITLSRGQNSVILGYAGGDTARNGVIIVGSNETAKGINGARDIGPITETAPSSGIFEFDFDIEYTDGPASSLCPDTKTYDSTLTPGTRGGVLERFNTAPSSGTDYCILQGDIITVEYTDPADASGDVNTVTDSATFDLRNGVLQSDKSVYIIGSDMILTLIEPDFDLDNDQAETYDLDLIEWDSDAATLTMGDKGGESAAFDPEPSDLRETGDSTGIFQAVIEIPKVLKNDNLERGEEIVLEYTDWGPAGADFVGQENEDINLTIFTSNFGATVELDQKVYTWTDKVYITVVAPDHNFDSNLIDQIGTSAGNDPLKVATRGHKLSNYKLVETGTDTGIFTGEVILTGFCHDADGKSSTGAGPGEKCAVGSDTNPRTSGSGPTDGFLEADDDDGLTVSYEFSEDETVVGSALIRWNIGEVTWLEATYPASGTGVVRVIDPDMNLNPEAVDNFNVNVWSDSDAGGIDLTVTETNEATGIFEGTVFFTTTDSSSGHRLRVAEGDTVTAEYKDNTLPDPYTTADELDITGTAFIGTVVPPLERAPASNARVVDAFGNTLDKVSVDQQVQITADLTNGQDREQPFAYLVQIQDDDGVTVSLAWITGSLSAGQSFSPALSWTPTAAGTYTATVFVWESVDNPTALSPPVEVTINVK
jgi:translation initiation factor IF-1